MNRIQLESEIDEILDKAINELDRNEYMTFLDNIINRLNEMKVDFIAEEILNEH